VVIVFVVVVFAAFGAAAAVAEGAFLQAALFALPAFEQS
jgi:hypothetical protein